MNVPALSGRLPKGTISRPVQALLIGLPLYLLERWAGVHLGFPGWISGGFTDVLCLPLVLSLVLLVHRRRRRSPGWTLPRRHGLIVLILYGVVFEALLPRFLHRGTADPWDLAAYGVGWILFEILVNRPSAVVRRNHSGTDADAENGKPVGAIGQSSP